MSKRRRLSQLASIDEINMTPLIDLTFLLLIVFMITMPLVENHTQVETPKMNSEKIPDKETLTIVLKLDGSIILKNQTVNQFKLVDYLNNLKISQPEAIILIKADKNCRYEEVIELMKTIKTSGFDNISLVTGVEK